MMINELRARRRKRLYEAVGIDRPSDLPDEARKILEWLTSLDDFTVDGVVQLIEHARVEAAKPLRDELHRTEDALQAFRGVR